VIHLGPAHLVGIGGATGALLRYLVSEFVPAGEYPYGTIAVNVLGSFLLGLAVFAGIGGDTGLLVGTGLLGAFTTFSSFSFETVRLWETGDRRRAVGNLLGTFLGAVGAIGVAWAIARLL
jgi:CrcB protein